MWHTLKYWALIGQYVTQTEVLSSELWLFNATHGGGAAAGEHCAGLPLVWPRHCERGGAVRGQRQARQDEQHAPGVTRRHAPSTLCSCLKYGEFRSFLNFRRWRRRMKINILFSHFLLHIHKEKLSIRGFEAVIISKLSIKGWMFISQSSLYLMSGINKWISTSYSA